METSSVLTAVSYHHLQLSISRVQFCSSRGYRLRSIMHAAVVVILWTDTVMHHERQTRQKRYFLPPQLPKKKRVIFKLSGLFLNSEHKLCRRGRIVAIICLFPAASNMICYVYYIFIHLRLSVNLH